MGEMSVIKPCVCKKLHVTSVVDLDYIIYIYRFGSGSTDNIMTAKPSNKMSSVDQVRTFTRF